MSRFGDGDYEPIIDKRGREVNVSGLWEANVQRALKGKRGQAALRDLRDALLALPEKRLIEGALCTVKARERVEAMPLQIVREVRDHSRNEAGEWVWSESRPKLVDDYERRELIDWIEEEGDDLVEGVCAVAAYVWWQKVKAGMDPDAAFASIPIAPHGEWETLDAGRDAGLTMALATELAYRNDERLGGASPEERYGLFMTWINKQLVPA